MPPLTTQKQSASKTSTFKKGGPAKSTLAVKMLIARTQWLDGPCFWRDGEIVWMTGTDETVPDAKKLSQTQKCLNKIGGFPRAAAFVLGDAPAWLARQREKLETAKRLCKLSGLDPARLAGEARRQNPAVAGEICRLLAAEALCCNALPVAPSEALIALGRAGVGPLQALLREDAPEAVHALAALVLGAISRKEGAGQTLPSGQKRLTQRACLWGWQHGLSREPALAAAILAKEATGDNGDGLAERCLRAVKQETGPRQTKPRETVFGLPAALLREMLAAGLSAATVTALAEAAQAVQPAAERLLKVRQDLPDRRHRQERQAVSEARRAERQRIVQSLAECMKAYAWVSQDPATLRLGTIFLHQMLDIVDQLTPHSDGAAAVLAQALDIMQAGLRLPPAMQQPYFEILAARHEIFWDRASLASGDRPRLENNRVRAWLFETQRRFITPLHILLSRTQDKAVTVTAFDRGIAQELAGQEWTDPDFFRLYVSLAASFDLSAGHYFRWYLSRVLKTCASAGEARSYFQQLLAPLQSFSAPVRAHILETVWSETGYTRQALHGQVPPLVPLLAAFARFAEQEDGEDEEWCCCSMAVEAALALTQAVPEEAEARAIWLLSFLSGLPGRKEWTYAQDLSFRTGMRLAIALTAADAGQFQQAIQTAARHYFRQDLDHVKNGLRFVDRFSALHASALRGPLAHLFPQRVADILVRLGLTTRLGTDAAALLKRLEPQAAYGSDYGSGDGSCFPVFLRPDASWWNLHRQMPQWTEASHAYLHAQWLTGRSQDMPPGVRRALEKPQRTAAELAHLEKMLAEKMPAAAPARPDLALRAAKLRDLLADTPRLWEEIQAEVGERLPQAVAEAQTAAIERQVLACYRTRLEAIAGPLPPSLVLGDDLINAVLLSVDVAENRKLLLRLIRAHVSRDTDWRERHPANEAFLELMAGRGMKRDAWLSKFPRRYSCAAAPGKWLHLCLEQDPLHILQMGNHFGTCLSFGGINAFSTVANACELNKRVIYARDHAGHVVGRKLIGINAEGQMIGFHTYGSLTGEESNAALRAVLEAYAASFAARCALTLAETGTVPTLFAENWYDDGAVEWNAAEAAPGGVKPK